MKKLVAILLAVIMLACSVVYAEEGLLPQFDDVFGIEVPSMANSLGREPDSDSVNEEGEHVQIFESVTEEDYQEFSNYLNRKGCFVSSYSLDGSILHILLKKDEIEFTLDYDIEKQQAVMTYPSSVRIEAFHIYRVGAIVTFGRYEQDNNVTNGPEPIEWIVLEVDTDNVLLISRYALDVVPFNSLDKSIRWRDCTLREWLNNTFYYTAFSNQEQSAVMITHIDNSAEQGNPRWLVDGVDTEDKVFLLSYKEAETYFNDDEARICFPTEYAIAKKVKVETGEYGQEGACRWWLRSRGYDPNFTCNVKGDGSIFCYYSTSATHFAGNDCLYADRPVIRVHTSFFDE